MLATSSYNNIDNHSSLEVESITESDQEANEITSGLGDSLFELELHNINLTETDPSTNRVTTDLVRLYLQDIGRVPLLTKEEELSKSRQVQRYVELLDIRHQATETEDEMMSQFVQVHRIHDELMAYLGHRPSWEKWAKASVVSVFELKEILAQGKRQWAVLANMDVEELKEIQKSGTRAKDEMIKANLRLGVSGAKKYQHRGLELLDLIQEGTLGLEKAVKKFDPVKGYRFSTYAYWWIRQGITRAIATQSRIIRLPVHVTEKLNNIKQVQRKISHTKNRHATLEEIGEELDLSGAQVQELLMKIPRSVSLEVKVGKEKDTELVDLLESEIFRR